MSEKDEQLSKVYKLLDQQQQLELGTQKRLKLLENGADLSTDKAEEVKRLGVNRKRQKRQKNGTGGKDGK